MFCCHCCKVISLLLFFGLQSFITEWCSLAWLPSLIWEQDIFISWLFLWLMFCILPCCVSLCKFFLCSLLLHSEKKKKYFNNRVILTAAVGITCPLPGCGFQILLVSWSYLFLLKGKRVIYRPGITKELIKSNQ